MQLLLCHVTVFGCRKEIALIQSLLPVMYLAFGCRTYIVSYSWRLVGTSCHVVGVWFMGGSRGGQGVQTPPPPGIAKSLIFAMLKFSVRPRLGIGTPTENIFLIRACGWCKEEAVFWSGNLFLIAPFPDLCLLVPSYATLTSCHVGVNHKL